MTRFAALHMSAHGTKRTYRRRLQFVRFRCEADMRRSVASTASVANDPQQSLAGSKSRIAAVSYHTALCYGDFGFSTHSDE
jgi:hypothetical protein